MDYFGLLKKAFVLPWKHKYLIWLGILAGIGSAGAPNFNYAINGADYQNWFNNVKEQSLKLEPINKIVPKVLGASTNPLDQGMGQFLNNNLYWIGLLLLILFLVFLILAIIRIMANAGLLHAVNELEENRKSSFSSAFVVGFHFFWRMLAVSILTALAGILIVSILTVPLVLFFVYAWVGGIIYLIPYILIIIIVFVYIRMVVMFWMRFLVLRDKRVFLSLKNAITMVNKKFKEVVVVLLIDIVAGIIYGIAVLIVAFIIALPFVAIALGLGLTLGLVAGIIAGAVGFLVLLAACFALGGYYAAFISSFWTFAYRELDKI